MMRVATAHAYDVMSNVHVKLTVREYPDSPEDESNIVFECTTTVPGTGESDPRQWAVDALVGLIEAI